MRLIHKITIILEGIASKNFIKNAGTDIEINSEKEQTENALMIFSPIFLKTFLRNMYTAYAMKKIYNKIIPIRE